MHTPLFTGAGLGADVVCRYPTMEGVGNHDGGNSTSPTTGLVRRTLIARNRQRQKASAAIGVCFHVRRSAFSDSLHVHSHMCTHTPRAPSLQWRIDTRACTCMHTLHAHKCVVRVPCNVLPHSKCAQGAAHPCTTKVICSFGFSRSGPTLRRVRFADPELFPVPEQHVRVHSDCIAAWPCVILVCLLNHAATSCTRVCVCVCCLCI